MVDIVSDTTSIHEKYNFDLASENSLFIGNDLASDEIKFDNIILSDYSESRTNEAISIDGISDQFNDLPRATAFSDIADFNLEKIRGGKFFISLAFDTRFSGEKQILQMNLLHDGSVGYLVPFW